MQQPVKYPGYVVPMQQQFIPMQFPMGFPPVMPQSQQQKQQQNVNQQMGMGQGPGYIFLPAAPYVPMPSNPTSLPPQVDVSSSGH